MSRSPVLVVLGLVVLGLAPVSADAATGDALIVVDVPLHDSPVLAASIVRGARLAAAQINDAGGVRTANGTTVRLRIRAVDSEGSPTTTRENVRRAIADHAVAVIDEGTGVDAAWEDANAAGLPIGIVRLGAASLVDPGARPNVFRIAPTDHGIAYRFAEYLVPKGERIALVTDDSVTGLAGRSALHQAFSRNPDSVVADVQVPAGGDPAPQLVDARAAGANRLLVWADASTVAAVVRTARQSGWDVRIASAPSAADPLVRQSLADHPEWLDGLTFAMSRLTSEKGPAPFESFERAYVHRFGPDDVGVRAGGRQVIQLPEYPMYSHDFVELVARAIQRSGSTVATPRLVKSLERVEITGANGDERSFNERSHEGVVDDDVFFASFSDMQWAPVKDDALSATLPALRQTR